MQRNGLLKVSAAERPPEITGLNDAGDWKFETRALADEFRSFDVTALSGDSATITIFERIGDDGEGGGVTAAKVGGILRNIGARPITVEMNSPGGNYFEGVAIYNMFRRHPAKVTMQILGIAASAASVIAMAGDEVQIAHNAEIMIHEAQGLFFGSKSDMAEAIEILTHLDQAMVSTYAARSGREASEFSDLIAGKDHYFRGQEAINAGLADALMEREAQMPVYADASFPTDQASLDRFLAKHNMPRSERRELFRAIKPVTPSADGGATPNAGDEPDPDFLRALSVLS